MLPAVLYGRSLKGAVPLALTLREFMKVMKEGGESTLIDLEIEGQSKKNVLVHEVAFDPVKDVPIHVDLYEVDMTKPIRAHVPLVFTGESEVVKGGAGILVKVLHEVEVEALPKDLPHELGVDIGKLKAFNDHIVLRDVALPRGVKIHGDSEAMVVLVKPPRSEEELEALKAKPEEVSLESIEVVRKKEEKREETEASGEEK